MQSIYHEKQSKRLCGLHSVNNMLQQNVYTEEDMDNLCYELNDNRWFNPHRGLGGYYDINVVEKALNKKDREIKWHDRRTEFNSNDNLNNFWKNENLVGILVNSEYKEYFMTKHHWLTILKQDQNQFVNLDSKIAKEQTYDFQQLLSYLNSVQKNNGHVIYVLRK